MSGQDWSDFLQVQEDLVRVYAGTGGLVRVSSGAGGIGQAFCRNRRDWSDILLEQAGLVKLGVCAGGISQTFCRSGLV